MEVNIETEKLIRELTERLANRCPCGFDRYKKDLEPLKSLLDKRWEEDIPTSCI